VTRFSFTPDAEFDMDEITGYLQDLPQAHALRIGRELQKGIATMTQFPGLGRIDHKLTMATHTKVLRFVSGKYVIFYCVGERSILILGVLPGKRDIEEIMGRRLK
jgi:plasmid stabilization system protein ParE